VLGVCRPVSRRRSSGSYGRRRMPRMTALTARADVSTDTPERYARQLLSHLGQRTAWTTDGNTATAKIAGGIGRVVVSDGVLTLIAEAPGLDTLARVQHVLGSHLERFGLRNAAGRHLGQRRRPQRCADPAGLPADHRRPGRH
jgi:uncharacterized protein